MHVVCDQCQRTVDYLAADGGTVQPCPHCGLSLALPRPAPATRRPNRPPRDPQAIDHLQRQPANAPTTPRDPLHHVPDFMAAVRWLLFALAALVTLLTLVAAIAFGPWGLLSGLSACFVAWSSVFWLDVACAAMERLGRLIAVTERLTPPASGATETGGGQPLTEKPRQ